MIETRFGTIRLEREYSKKHRRPVGVTAYFFRGYDAKTVATMWRNGDEAAVESAKATSGTARIFSGDQFCWREGNKIAITKALFVSGLDKLQRTSVWQDIAKQMSLAGKKK